MKGNRSQGGCNSEVEEGWRSQGNLMCTELEGIRCHGLQPTAKEKKDHLMAVRRQTQKEISAKNRKRGTQKKKRGEIPIRESFACVKSGEDDMLQPETTELFLSRRKNSKKNMIPERRIQRSQKREKKIITWE